MEEIQQEFVDDNYEELNKSIFSAAQNTWSSWFTKMIPLQAEIFTTCLVSLISPIFYILSFASEESEKKVAAAVEAIPSKVVHGSSLLVKKVGVGILGAAYVGMVLMTTFIVSGVLGFGLVRMLVEQPLVLREKLYFDYAHLNPNAVFSFAEFGSAYNHKNLGVPFGHTFHVSLFLLMPESDFNRDVGVFQVVAEALSMEGHIMARSSHPCMLRFRSLPIRLMREFIMSVPLVLGITAETQMMTVPLLKHKEGFPRTGAIRITLIPRAGTLALPQLYHSEIILKSRLPWYKDLVYRWKWTLSVWTSMYIYVSLLIILLSWCRPFIFPLIAARFKTRVDESFTVVEQPQERARDVSESLRRWRQTRRKRKAMLQQNVFPELDDSASSISITREDTAESSE